MRKIVFCLLCMSLGSGLCIAQGTRQVLMKQIRDFEEKCSQQENLLNEGYVYVGKLKENLSSRKYCNRTNLPFKKIDLRQLTEIKVSSPRVRIASPMPSKSYKISHPDSTCSIVSILDKKLFWKISNKLIVQTDYRADNDSAVIVEKVIEENLFNEKRALFVPKKPQYLALTSKVSNETLVNIIDSLLNIIDEYDTELNRCYYITGSRRELKLNEIVTGGGLHGIKANPNGFDEHRFVEKDVRMLKSIPIPSENLSRHNNAPRLLTPAPEGSYRLQGGGENGITVLEIIDPARFWELSRFLVVMY